MGRRRDLAPDPDHADDHPCPARAHALDERIDHVHVGKELRVEGFAPYGRREVGNRSPARGAGGIDENVDRSELRLDLVDHLERRAGVGAVRRDAESPRQIRLRPLDVFRRARADRHARAFGQKPLRAGEADSLRAAGDEDDLAIKSKVHGRLACLALSGSWTGFKIARADPTAHLPGRTISRELKIEGRREPDRREPHAGSDAHPIYLDHQATTPVDVGRASRTHQTAYPRAGHLD